MLITKSPRRRESDRDSESHLETRLKSDRLLEGQGLGKYAEAFDENDIDLDVLPVLSDDELKELGLSLGHRKKLLMAIGKLGGGVGVVGADVDQPAVASTADTTPPSGEAERRQLTVMFCDLVGSTALSTKLDPEDMGDVIRAYQETCTRVVESCGGHVAKYMGDGILVYFGYPMAHEYDAENAVRAGLEIAETVPRLRVGNVEDLAARIGIATGLVMVGELVGAGAAREEAVVGDTPNLAARLQDVAAPGSVAIAGETRQLLGDMFELESMGQRALKAGQSHFRICRGVTGDSRCSKRRF